MSKFIDIRFEFDEEHDDEYTRHELNRIHLWDTNMTQEQTGAIAEMWGQSDNYWIGVCSGIIETLDGGDFDPRA